MRSLTDTEEVIGSIPIPPTILKRNHASVGLLLYARWIDAGRKP
jgi:hypothetical protein